MSDDTSRIFLTGANRGLGLEYARQWAAKGWRVFASCRSPEAAEELNEVAEAHPERLTVVRCDVTDEGSVRSAAETVAADTEGLEVVLNNAGVGGWRGRLEELDFDEVRRVFEINTLGPMRVTRAFTDLLRKGREPRRLVHMTSLMGSIDDNRSGGAWPYRLTKCALNMAGVNMAHEFREDGIVSVVLHPGWVRTDMGGSGATLAVDEAVAALVGTIESLTLEDTGRFYDRNGDPLPW